MTDPAILEALARVIAKHENPIGRSGYEDHMDTAAAVLGLCGPEKLVWTTLGDGKGRYRLDSSISVAKHEYGHYYISLPCNSGSDYYWSGPAYSGGKYYPTLEAAQCAAQAHADAAHWAGTPLGKLVGVV